MSLSYCVVTATTNIDRAMECIPSWGEIPLIVVVNGPLVTPRRGLPSSAALIRTEDYLGSVAAFARGVDYALRQDYDIIACLHDDLRIDDPMWAEKVRLFFDAKPACGLAGFGGATGLGSDDIYQTPYDPMQLARQGFMSNLQDAEAHGTRSLIPSRVACLDGFSLIGRRKFWGGCRPEDTSIGRSNTFYFLHEKGMTHHAYDSATGICAAGLGWEVWYLPIRCHHFGGRTAVGDSGYTTWAQTQTDGGDHGFWQRAHEALYTLGRGILPIRA